jgi:uncharacterized protein (TIGR00661 family)
MKILYGIQGNGNGHITRSQKIINRLKKRGFDVDILISGESHELDIIYDVKYRFKGFKFNYNDDGGVNRLKTFFKNDFSQFLKDTRIKLKQYDHVISDFEPITAWAGKWQNKYTNGIANQYSFLSKNTPRPDNIKLIDEFVLKHFAPVNNPIGIHYQEYDQFINIPIIRDDILKISLNDYGHYVIYLPNIKTTNLIKRLKNKKICFHIFSNEVKKQIKIDNCKIFPTDKNIFLNSFTSSHGIITSGGFQTTSEAIYCGKKLLVIPTIGQYEQISNAAALKNLNIEIGEDINSIDRFLLSDKIIKIKWLDPTEKIIDTLLPN